MSIVVPQGFRVAGVHCGVKRDPSKLDLTLVVSDSPAVAAGVYTQNRVFAAPVAFDRSRTPAADVRTVVVNSGNANACTGQRGMDDAQAMARAAADACGADEKQALVMSTGVIGSFLPMDKILAGIRQAGESLDNSAGALEAAARGMMTTDTVYKIAGGPWNLAGKKVQITGLAKGSAMIGPNMATMLGLVLTDAALKVDDAQDVLR